MTKKDRQANQDPEPQRFQTNTMKIDHTTPPRYHATQSTRKLGDNQAKILTFYQAKNHRWGCRCPRCPRQSSRHGYNNKDQETSSRDGVPDLPPGQRSNYAVDSIEGA